MNRITKILVAVDFSPASSRALLRAIDLSKSLGASLDLVHVLDVPAPSVSPYGVVTSDSDFGEIRSVARSKLDALRQQLVSRGLEAYAHFAEPPAASAIDELAQRLEADLIVMGTRGNTGLRHVLLGSVAERTLRHAPCSVLTVK